MFAKISIGVALSVFGAHCAPHYRTVAAAPKAPAVYECTSVDGFPFFTDDPQAFTPHRCHVYDVQYHDGLERRGCRQAGSKTVTALPPHGRHVECVK